MSSICSAFRSALKTPGSNGASPASTAQPPLIGSRILQANKQNSAHELPLQVSSLQFPSDYGLPLYNTITSLPRHSTNVNGTSNYSSLQPSFFPKVGGNMMPDEQYPTLPFRSPYIHTADSGPSAIVYYPSKGWDNTQSDQCKVCFYLLFCILIFDKGFIY